MLNYNQTINRKKYLDESFRKKRERKGEKHSTAKLRLEEVREIRKLIEEGIPLSDISKRYWVSTASIVNIKVGRTWKNL